MAEPLTALQIKRIGVKTWTIIENGIAATEKGENAYTGGAHENGTINIKTMNGATVRNQIPFQIISYTDTIDSGNDRASFTSAAQFLKYGNEVGFFVDGSSGSGAATSFTQLEDTFPTYIGREGQALVVNESATGVASVPFNNVNVSTDLADFPAELVDGKYLKVVGGVWQLVDGIEGDQNNVGRKISVGFTTSEYPTITDIILRLNATTTVISDTDTPVIVYISTLPNSEGVVFVSSKVYPYLFLPGKGTYGIGGSTVIKSMLYPISVVNTTPEDITSDTNNEINNLDPVIDGDFVTKANESVWDFTDSTYPEPDKNYYFTYTDDGVLYFALFVGEPGVYGSGGTQFTGDDFITTTNSEEEPNPVSVLSVTGDTVDNTDPQNPIVKSLFVFADSFEGTDSEKIQAGLNFTAGTGKTLAITTKPGDNIWLIDEANLLDSDTNVAIINTTIQLSDTCRDNGFRTVNTGIGISQPWLNPLKNIHIYGVGNAVLKGAERPRSTGDNNKTLSLTSAATPPTGVTYSYGTDAGNPEERQFGDWRNIMVAFCFTENCSIKNLSIVDAHGYSVTFERCKRYATDSIYLNSSRDRVIDGVNQRVQNCDGLKTVMGGSFGRFMNTTGHTDDNLFTAGILGAGLASPDDVPGNLNTPTVTGQTYMPEYDNIHDVTIINADVYCYNSIFRCLNTMGSEIYNVKFLNVNDTSVASELTREITGGAAIFGSFNSDYGGPTPMGTCRNITIDNVKMVNSRYGINLQGTLSESTITNFSKEKNNTYPAIYINPSSGGMRNVQVTNIYDRGLTILNSGVYNGISNPFNGISTDVATGVKTSVGVLNYPAGVTYTYDEKTLIPKEYADAVAAGKQDKFTGQGFPFILPDGSIQYGGAGNGTSIFLTNGVGTASRPFVVGQLLAGISIVNAAVVAADNILQGIGKLQGQINAILTSLGLKQDSLVSGTNIKTINGSSLLASGDLAVGDVNQGGNSVTSAMSVGTINDFDFLIKRNNITQVTFSDGNINTSGTLTLTGAGNVLTLPLGSTINGASGNGGYITIATATTPMVYGKNGTGVGHQFRVPASHASDIATFTKATSIVSGVRSDGSFYTSGDVEITDSTKGVILKSPNGTRYRVTVSDTGVLTTTAI